MRWKNIKSAIFHFEIQKAILYNDITLLVKNTLLNCKHLPIFWESNLSSPSESKSPRFGTLCRHFSNYLPDDTEWIFRSLGTLPTPAMSSKNSDILLHHFSSCLLQFLRPTLKYSQTYWICLLPVGRDNIFDVRKLKLQLQSISCL
jgi:hypothetical protein